MDQQDASEASHVHTEAPAEAPVAKENKEVAPKCFFERVKEVVSNVLGSIRNGIRRAFCWVKSKFSPKGDDTDV